jgi:hypothetical protein
MANLSRNIAILWMWIKVRTLKLLFLCVGIPLGFCMITWEVIRGQSSLGEYINLFSPYEWQYIFGNGIECYVGCRYWITGVKRPNAELPPYTYWTDFEEIGCLFIDDAVAINMIYGGNLTKNPRGKGKKNNNADK